MVHSEFSFDTRFMIYRFFLISNDLHANVTSAFVGHINIFVPPVHINCLVQTNGLLCSL
jgi:hypothetical protein